MKNRRFTPGSHARLVAAAHGRLRRTCIKIRDASDSPAAA
jgi:hypothetical protein